MMESPPPRKGLYRGRLPISLRMPFLLYQAVLSKFFIIWFGSTTFPWYQSPGFLIDPFRVSQQTTYAGNCNKQIIISMTYRDIPPL